VNYQWVIDRVDDYIVDHSKTVIVAFLLATVVFTGGLSGIETESGQQQFIEDLPSFQALEDVQRDFGASFPGTTTTTTVVQTDQNVLSKPALLDLLRTQERLADEESLRVENTSSAAVTVARRLDPEATTLEQQIVAVERATPKEIDAAVRRAAERPAFRSRLSSDFNRRSASAMATEATITHHAGPGAGGGGGPGGAEEFPPDAAERIERIAAGETTASTVRALGVPPDTTTTTLTLVLPIAFLLIVLMLAVAYRDPVDLLIGLVGIIMTLIWTFGFIGLVGIPFAVLLIAVPPILIAVGIDFGIHAINRYREERVDGTGVTESMRATTDQVSVAFFIVMGTSAIGFLSNVVSAFPPTRDFGITAAAGILFTSLIFGVFVPATKVTVDRLRERYPIPTVTQTPFGSERSPLGRALAGGVTVAERAPVAFVLLVVLTTAGAGVYASGVETGFSPDDFQPAAETPEYLQHLPEGIRPPAEFEYVKLDDFRDEHFDQEGQVLMYVEGPMREDAALEALHRAGNDPPPTFERNGTHAESRSVVTLIENRAERDPSFRRVVERNDRDDDGIPDDDLSQVYAALEDEDEDEDGEDQLSQFLSADRRSTLVIYSVDADEPNEEITADAYRVAADTRYSAQPTGNAVIFDEALSLVLETVIQSLVLTLIGAALFLVFIYWVVEGSPSLGVANIVPILVTIVALVASMRLVGIKFNAINGTILAIAVGLGIDYSVHIVHRFVDEYETRALYPALRRTVVGTGGALTGSMLTTVFGVGVLAIALNPAVGVFGILIALSVLYAYLTSIFVLPSILVLWARFVDDEPREATVESQGGPDSGPQPVAAERNTDM
jgi:predicted RND superfamily exporter protein